MIKESTIDRVLARLEAAQEDFEQEINDFAEAQPHLMAYVASDENEVFTENELELLLFGTLVIYQSITDERTEPPVAEPHRIEKAEEANYAVINAIKGNFRAKLDPFFETTTEEELLAFAEDLLNTDPEEGSVTKEAREPLFICLKTVVDVLTVIGK